MKTQTAVEVEEINYTPGGGTSGLAFTNGNQQQHPRRSSAAANILGMLVNTLVAACPIYFVTFGILALKHDDESADLTITQNLLQASIYGPTIFPVMFAAIVGRFLKSVADLILEQGTTIATIEYVLASRTVSGVLFAPFRFRTFRMIVLPLVLLWALSPLGSQASLRVVLTDTLYTNTSQLVSYVNVNGSQSYSGGSNGQDYYQNVINSVFNAALFSPITAKDASQDIYGHVKIPMLEAVQDLSDTDSPSDDGWTYIRPQDYNASIYSSLVGLPCSGVPPVGNTTYAVETSYFALDCTLNGSTVDLTGFTESWQNNNPSTSGTAWNGGQMSLSYDLAHYNDTSRPRSITLWSLNRGQKTLSVATCNMTTTYVEVQVSCISRKCSANAIRNSTLAHAPSTWSVMDNEANAARNTFNYFVNTTAKPHVATSSPMEFFLDNPRATIGSTSEVVLANVNATAFSQRFAQLLNSYWMITLTPDGALGKDFTDGITPYTSAKSILALVQTDQRVMHCERSWLAILLLASITMFAAGIATAVLDAKRKGPDILDVFVTGIRESPYARLAHYSSLEEGSEQVRRLRNVKVQLGDVQSSSSTGYAAVAATDDAGFVEPLRQDRLYR